MPLLEFESSGRQLQLQAAHRPEQYKLKAVLVCGQLFMQGPLQDDSIRLFVSALGVCGNTND